LYILKKQKKETVKVNIMDTIKCNVAKITSYGNGGGVTLMPVTGNSEENKQFWNNVPTGKIVLHVDAELYLKRRVLDFTKL
jgi:hypothetical protein